MKKRICAIICSAAVLLNTVTALAFEFPEPDWRALLDEKRDMVNAIDFELYTEGDVSNAPYYGARLENKNGTYLGMIAETSENYAPLGSYLTYVEAMNQNDLYYPANEIIKNSNSAVMVGWNFSNVDYVDTDGARALLNTLSKYNKPMFIRIACEMNVAEMGNEPDKYIEFFRKIAQVVHEFPNFATVWSPNDLGGLDRDFSYYYPGDEYVDWVGVSCYTIKYFMGEQNTAEKDSIYFMTGDYSWATNRLKPIINFLEKNNINKPVMISEGGVPTNNTYGEDYAQWSTPRLKNLLWYVAMKYPQVKMINYFNTHRGNEVERFDLNGYAWAENIFKEASQSGNYIRSVGQNAAFEFTPAASGNILYADNGAVNLYTLAYFPKQPDVSVQYFTDGAYSFEGASIPYKYSMNISQLSNGMHTLTIKSAGTEKTYDFMKNDNYIRFGSYADMPINVVVFGYNLTFTQPPVIVNDRTLVPLRAIFEALGADVDWNGDTKCVTAKKDGSVVSLTIGSNVMTVNGADKELDVPSQIINDRTMVPVRAISEAFGNNVNWNGDTKTVEIN